MVVLSNCHERDVRCWGDSPLAPYFIDALFSCRTGLAKPDQGAFTAALTRLGVAAPDAVFVGDGGSDELTGARRAGFGLVVCVTGLALKSGFRTQADLEELMNDADAAIEGVEHLPGLLTSRS
jgi:putative hydrolase of the HAD superfamily